MVLPKTRTPAGQSPPSVLDEVASPALVIGSKKPLQAHVDGALLGQSATQLYSYFVFLWRVPIILTTNNWDCSGFSEADKNWLETNCVTTRRPPRAAHRPPTHTQCAMCVTHTHTHTHTHTRTRTRARTCTHAHNLMYWRTLAHTHTHTHTHGACGRPCIRS